MPEIVGQDSDTRKAPRLLLPVGVTTGLPVRFEWNGAAGDGFRIVVSTESTPADGGVLHDTGVVDSRAGFYLFDRQLPTRTLLFGFAKVRRGRVWSGWSDGAPFRVDPVLRAGGTLRMFDLHYTRNLSPERAFEHAHLAAALQGIVNRESPCLYLEFIRALEHHMPAGAIPEGDVDGFWLKRLRKTGAWLSEMDLRRVKSLGDLVGEFQHRINGVVVWDRRVPATSNVASTIAGADDLLPVPFDEHPDSLYSRLVKGGPRLPVAVNLLERFPFSRKKTNGSAKADAYLWVVNEYLRPGLCSPRELGYYLDAWWIKNPGAGGDFQNHTLTNHDFFVGKRGFFFDLGVWSDEAPIDDPDQRPGLDREVLEEILHVAATRLDHDEMIHVGGFTPWAFKYTNAVGAGGKHGGVDTEWETARLFSAYNAVLDADALGLGAMANASVATHMPLPVAYSQVLRHTPSELREASMLDENLKPEPGTYFLHYVGDYDSAAWVWCVQQGIWETASRGREILPWAVNPNLIVRAAPAFEHMYRTRTANDVFMAGDSGAGYVNPTQLIAPRVPDDLPGAEAAWRRRCEEFYGRFGIGFTGFLINGHAPITAEAEAMYVQFSSMGIVNQDVAGRGPLHSRGKMPVFKMQYDLGGDVAADAATVKRLETAYKDENERAGGTGDAGGDGSGNMVRFMVFRTILQDPDYYVRLNTELRAAKAKDKGAAGVGDGGAKLHFCDPFTFGALARGYLGIGNENLASYVLDNLPDRQKPGVAGSDGAEGSARGGFGLECVVRNDGWNPWVPGRHGLRVVWTDGTRFDCRLDDEVEPGQFAIFKQRVKVDGNWRGKVSLGMMDGEAAFAHSVVRMV